MKYTVSTNWDERLIDELKGTEVITLFGKLNEDIIGGGRPPLKGNDISREYAQSYIRKAIDNGFEFNYLLNASSFANKEFNKQWHQKMLNFLDWLVDIGVGKFTITTPYLIELVKNRYPHIKVSVSSYCKIKSVKQAKYFEELGADDICLTEAVNRDYETLKKIKKSVSASIVLIANNICTFHCPYSLYHGNYNSFSSQTDEHKPITKPYFYCKNRCVHYKFERPEEFIKSRWIRPEDTGFYEDLGVDVLKIVDRVRPTDWILRAVRAYQNKKYEGNLMDIMSLPIHVVKTIEQTYKHIMAPGQKGVAGPPDSFAPFVDNAKLDNFIKGFAGKDCENEECDSCGYCNTFADKAITMPAQTAQIKEVLKFGWENLVNSNVILQEKY